MSQKFETYEELGLKMANYGKENPEVMTAFSKLHDAGSKDGALSFKYKELIALGIGIYAKCEGCIIMHIQDAINAGASHGEIVETIGTAIYMGGGPAVIYGAKAFTILQAYEAENGVK